MHKPLLTLIFIQALSLNVYAEPLNLEIDKTPTYDIHKDIESSTLNLNPQTEGSFEGLNTEKKDKSAVPVVLSVSFLLMSLYGDNPDSSMYRTLGATATIASFSWYFD